MLPKVDSDYKRYLYIEKLNFMWEVQMQFIPGSDQIWVARLNPSDPIYQYDNELEAQIKADELQVNDPSGRKYRVAQIG